MTAQEAIERSISHNEIVHIAWTEEAEEALRAECDDSVDNSAIGVVEFWGTRGETNDWRVHLNKPADGSELELFAR